MSEHSFVTTLKDGIKSVGTKLGFGGEFMIHYGFQTMLDQIQEMFDRINTLEEENESLNLDSDWFKMDRDNLIAFLKTKGYTIQEIRTIARGTK